MKAFAGTPTWFWWWEAMWLLVAARCFALALWRKLQSAQVWQARRAAKGRPTIQLIAEKSLKLPATKAGEQQGARLMRPTKPTERTTWKTTTKPCAQLSGNCRS
jgi:hypothetical protein